MCVQIRGVYESRSVSMLVCQPPSALMLNGMALDVQSCRQDLLLPDLSGFEDVILIHSVGMSLFSSFAAENSAKHEENGCNGNPYKIRSAGTIGQPHW